MVDKNCNDTGSQGHNVPDRVLNPSDYVLLVMCIVLLLMFSYVTGYGHGCDKCTEVFTEEESEE